MHKKTRTIDCGVFRPLIVRFFKSLFTLMPIFLAPCHCPSCCMRDCRTFWNVFSVFNAQPIHREIVQLILFNGTRFIHLNNCRTRLAVSVYQIHMSSNAIANEFSFMKFVSIPYLALLLYSCYNFAGLNIWIIGIVQGLPPYHAGDKNALVIVEKKIGIRCGLAMQLNILVPTHCCCLN